MEQTARSPPHLTDQAQCYAAIATAHGPTIKVLDRRHDDSVKGFRLFRVLYCSSAVAPVIRILSWFFRIELCASKHLVFPVPTIELYVRTYWQTVKHLHCRLTKESRVAPRHQFQALPKEPRWWRLPSSLPQLKKPSCSLVWYHFRVLS